MKASWNWLTDYVTVKAPVAEVAERLIMSGLIVESMEEVGEDIRLEVEITSNRPDWLSHIGIAREVAALYGLKVKVPAVKAHEEGGEASESASVEIDDTNLCPLYTARVIRGVKVGPSPTWLKEKIESVGLRSVNNVVDATNFVMYECGQPLHAFDLAKVRDKRIIVRPAVSGEHMTLIDGSKITLKAADLVIADGKGPVALAGVMGGIDSEIGDKTVDVLLEAARFDQYSIRVTGKRLGLASDASYRFERGVDTATVDWASRRCADIIMATAGGKLEKGVLVAGSDKVPHRTVTLRMARMAKVLGMEIPIEETRRILSSLDFVLRGGSPDSTVVEVPSFRGDVREEIDLIEEVARIYGYDKIPLKTGMKTTVGRRTARERVRDAVERVLTASGYYGTVSYSFVTGDLGRKYSPWTARPPVYIENRAGQENAYMRTSLVPSLLRVRKTNEDHKVERPDVFEVAHVYLPSDEQLPDQPPMVAAVTGDDFHALKGVFEKIIEELGGSGVTFVPARRDSLAEGRAADIRMDGRTIGYIGTLDESLRREVDLSTPVSVAELDLTAFEAMPDETKTFHPLARFPGIDRDIAVVVDEEVMWAQVLECVETSGAANIESIAFVSLYRGQPIPKGKKSLAFRILLRAEDRTLTGEEADAAQAKIVESLEKRLGGKLR
jgi:phenylalanyl-tRNA synthetase beta chain